MAKIVKSQWSFGELFPAEQTTRKVYSVAEFTTVVRRLLEKEFGQIWVSGEITNLRVQSSGHIYFTLKDASAQLSCVLFRGETDVDRSLLQDGRKVTVGGAVTVYDVRGQYQLRVTKLELQGVGALQAAFERLKQKLQAEGLFTQERKRPLPKYPQRIGLVTSPTGAAIMDVLHVVKRRNPSLEIVLAPCRVQGDGAASDIAGAIYALNEFHQAQSSIGGLSLDLILVTRGGGSLEDLWAFNEEIVARAIFASELPIVSAVGHEIDFTISDFVADLRAATPSAAAELITEGVFSSCQFVAQAAARLKWLVQEQLDARLEELRRFGHRLKLLHPRRRLEISLQRVDELQGDLARCARVSLRHQRHGLTRLAERLSRVRPGVVLENRRQNLVASRGLLGSVARRRVAELRARLDVVNAKLNLLGPEQTLARGYSITRDSATGRILRSRRDSKPGQRLNTRLADGEISSTVDASPEATIPG